MATQKKNETVSRPFATSPFSEEAPGPVADKDDLLTFAALSHDLMIVTDENGVILKTNPAFAAVMGVAPSSRYFAALFPAQDRARFKAALRHPQDFEARLVCENGDIRWIAWACRKAGAKIYFSGRDITDIKTQQADLTRRQRQLSEAEAIGRMGHWHWPVGQDEIAWSEELYRIFGVDPHASSPTIRSLMGMIHEEDAERLIQIFQRAVIEKKNYDMEFRLCRPDGDIRHIHCEGRCATDAEGDVVALYGIMQDMTERILYEEELRRAKNASEQAYEAKSRFLANMSHELRTPLNAIIGFSEMMGNQVFGPLGHEKYAGYVQDIRESGALLLDIIGDILDMSKIEAGKYALDLSEVSLGDVIARAAAMIGARARQNDVALNLPGESCAEITLVADRRALVQILLNLLSNAVKFTRPGGAVTVTCEKKARHCNIRIADTGVGIPPNKLAAVLRPFEQASSSYTRDHEGSGLGLSITRELVEMHGGTLSIASKSGVGTTVTVRLPYVAKTKTEIKR